MYTEIQSVVSMAASGPSAVEMKKLRDQELELLRIPLLDKTIITTSSHGFANADSNLIPSSLLTPNFAIILQPPDETSSTGSFDGFSSDINTGMDSFVSGMISPQNSSSTTSAKWDGDMADSSATNSTYSSPLPWLVNLVESDTSAATSDATITSCDREPSRSPANNGGLLMIDDSTSVDGLPMIINSQGTNGLLSWDYMDHLDHKDMVDMPKFHDSSSEAEMMKERFAKLLLGEDLSGGGKGVSTALAVSNAITNLSASIFGDLWRLEPLAEARKVRWQREMERLLSVSDYIVEFVPSSKSLADGTTMKVMDTKPRLDLHICLPALQKLDAMLIEALDSFVGTEFWYIDQSMSRPESSQPLQSSSARSSSGSSCADRWWLPTPKVPPLHGLSSESRKHLQHQRECVNQILKAALAVNAQVLSEMNVPIAFTDSLPKNGRSSLGEPLYRAMSSEKFSATELIACMDPTQEHDIVDLMNSVEAALHIWMRKLRSKQEQIESSHGQPNLKVLRALPKDGLIGLEKRQMLMERAKSLLLLLRLKFPGLPQSILDVSKIQYCKDVGQSILESYSRVLESLAFNIRSRIDDVIYADEAAKMCDQSQTAFSSRSNSKNGSMNPMMSNLMPSLLACGLASPGRPLQSESRGGLENIAANRAKELSDPCKANTKTWLNSYKHRHHTGKTQNPNSCTLLLTRQNN